MINKLMVAHRGYSAFYPENTMTSFRQAVVAGVKCIELDVRQTKDNIPVVLHDSTVDRTTDGTGTISDLTWEQVQQLDAGSWKDPQFAGEKIPSLEEVLEEFRQTEIFILVELKYETTYIGIEKQIGQLIKSKRMEQQCLFFSLDWDAVDRFKDYYPDIPTGLLTTDATMAIVKARAIAKKHEFISCDTSLTQVYVDEWHNAGLYVNVWTVDTEEALQNYYNMGIEMLSSNRCDYLMNIVVDNNIVQDTATYRATRKATPRVYNGTDWVKATPKKLENGELVTCEFKV